MSVIYQLAISSGQADSYLKTGLDLVTGFAIDAARAEGVTDVADLIALQGCDRRAFSPDRPIDILQMPAGPFVQVRRAVGPLNQDAFMGGIIENPPFNGSGTTQGGGVSTELLWIEPTRLTSGTRLWRFFPGDSEPELLGVYHGIAWGWETVKTGKFTAAIPSQFIGPIVTREWGALPVEMEFSEETDEPVALTMVSPAAPTAEEGFQELPTGLWGKRITYHSDLNIYEHQDVGRYKHTPVRIIRAVRNESGQVLAQIVSLVLDTPFASALGFKRIAQGTNAVLVPFDEIQEKASREARPKTWNVSSRPAITLQAARQRDNSDPQALVADILAMLTNVAPSGWQSLHLHIQMVGQMAHFAAMATVSSPAAEDAAGSSVSADAEDGDSPQTSQTSGKAVTLKLLPTSVLHYVSQLKKISFQEEVGAPYVLTLEFKPDGHANLTANRDLEPRWAAQVPASVWREDLKAFPRTDEHIPEWLNRRLEDTDD
ncbi:MAG: hypothetical protein ACTHW1_00860 [Ancrocorticia sp.]|uniref:hypothetical protein n=1 Tax=Ancrocorticia sp. TaxID=2593684 RepID=UPI003F919C7C